MGETRRGADCSLRESVLVGIPCSANGSGHKANGYGPNANGGLGFRLAVIRWTYTYISWRASSTSDAVRLAVANTGRLWTAASYSQTCARSIVRPGNSGGSNTASPARLVVTR